MKKVHLSVVLIAVILSVSVVVGMYFSYNNTEISLRTQAEAQRGKIESCHDAMWKIIKQQAQVADKYKTAFEKIYPELISGRYENGGGLMMWIKEANPEFDTALYKTLMESIEVQRLTFKRDQERMLDIIREHETLVKTVPGSWFIKNKLPIEYVIVSSSHSKMVMETGLDDDIDIDL